MRFLALQRCTFGMLAVSAHAWGMIAAVRLTFIFHPRVNIFNTGRDEYLVPDAWLRERIRGLLTRTYELPAPNAGSFKLHCQGCHQAVLAVGVFPVSRSSVAARHRVLSMAKATAIMRIILTDCSVCMQALSVCRGASCGRVMQVIW